MDSILPESLAIEDLYTQEQINKYGLKPDGTLYKTLKSMRKYLKFKRPEKRPTISDNYEYKKQNYCHQKYYDKFLDAHI